MNPQKTSATQPTYSCSPRQLSNWQETRSHKQKCKSWMGPVRRVRRVRRVGRVGRVRRVRRVIGWTLTKTDLLLRDPRETWRKRTDA